jgi:acetyl esterase/lipase
VSAPDLTLPYADHPCGLVDWHLPDGRTPADGTPVVLVVHGGFWKAEYDREHTRPQARALADLGHAVATPEYRRVAAGGGWPTTGLDVRAALDAVPGMAARLGFTPGPVTAVGHSAGGQLVLWLAATGAPLDHVVALAPVCDLEEAIRLHLGDGAAHALLGDLPPADADPMTLLERRPAGAVTVVHGTRDASVPVSLSRGLVARHPWIRYVEVDADHMELIDPGSTVWRDVTALL